MPTEAGRSVGVLLLLYQWESAEAASSAAERASWFDAIMLSRLVAWQAEPSYFYPAFRQTTGTTVIQWLLNQRLARAQRLLETTDRPIEIIALEAGFGSAISLRQHFRTAFNTSPSAYRKQFHRVTA